MDFKGTDYEPQRDEKRLSTQHKRVRTAALEWPGQWFTMQALAEYVGEPPGSVERQVRYLRDEKFGGYIVEKRHKHGGTFEYRVSHNFGKKDA
jgi:hypothetical protein